MLREQSPSDMARSLFGYLFVSSSAILGRWTTVVLKLGILILISILTLWDKVMAILFAWLSKLLSLPPCGVYSAHESAVVIIGGAYGKLVTRLLTANLINNQ